jgi:hypothetical protein
MVWIFSAPVQTGSEAHPASYTMGPGLPRGYSSRGMALTSHPPPSTKVKERVELYLYSPTGSLWPVLGWNLPSPCTFTFNARNERCESLFSCFSFPVVSTWFDKMRHVCKKCCVTEKLLTCASVKLQVFLTENCWWAFWTFCYIL